MRTVVALFLESSVLVHLADDAAVSELVVASAVLLVVEPRAHEHVAVGEVPHALPLAPALAPVARVHLATSGPTLCRRFETAIDREKKRE